MAKNIVTVSRPSVFLLRIVIFLILVGFIGAILYEQILSAFQANPALNGLIISVLAIGILYTMLQILRLYPEVKWLNHFRFADPASSNQKQPKLLASMANLLGGTYGPLSVSTNLMGSILDGVASRLDEARDISRYMVGLLVFLGLLGTFWGLLGTIKSVNGVIGALDGASTAGVGMFEKLKTGLQTPLTSMGTAFSSSLFGLAGSLILGFLDLQASQAQNRFYHETEEWLASSVEVEKSQGGAGGLNTAALNGSLTQLDASLQGFSQKIERLNTPSVDGADGAGTGELKNVANHLEQLVEQMRAEQTIVRQWVDEQAGQQADIRQLLVELNQALKAR